MEIGDPVVMIAQKLPDLHGPLFLTVERPIHQLDLRNLMLQEKGKL